MSTKNNTSLTYPCIVNICQAMGAKRKDPVIRALNAQAPADAPEDLSKMIVYPTLRNAYVAGFNLIKETIDSKWQRISKQETAEILKALAETGKLPEKPAKVVPVKVAKVKFAKTPVAAKVKTPKAPKKVKATAEVEVEAQEVTAEVESPEQEA